MFARSWLRLGLLGSWACATPAIDDDAGSDTTTGSDTTSAASTSTAASTASGETTATSGDTSDTSGTTEALPPMLSAMDPPLGDPLGGAWVTITGEHLAGASIHIGGQACTTLRPLDDTAILCRTPGLAPGTYDVEAEASAGSTVLIGAYEAWSPAQIDDARLFDARVGVTTADPHTHYEWQRTTASIADDWRVRDGNTLTYLPATGRFWMVAGWNGLQEPDGFSEVRPGTAYPMQNTTNEVWSSPDGVTWELELAHGHAQFERRHVHSAMLWRDALWIIGGDSHQGYYNHDVLRSDDGVSWAQVLAPGEPPWPVRGLQYAGVYDDALWTGGGQTLLGDEAAYEYHNDLWRSDDGVSWTLVAADGPGSTTRPAGCGMVHTLVEFQGRMWLVGCARYREVAGHELLAEVWSTTDGVTWQRHADPPWAGKAWHDVVVWDDKLWTLFGFTYGDPSNGWPLGNANEAWFSSDGETWDSLPPDAPVPGSHAQGVAVHDDFLLYAGGNYGFGFGAGFDRSAWRLVAMRGSAMAGWTDRGASRLSLTPWDTDAPPVVIADAFEDGEPGVHFDGSHSVLALAEADAQPNGRTVLWVARAPYLPAPWGWVEEYAPLATVVGGVAELGLPNASIGLSDGAVTLVNREPGQGPVGEPLWSRLTVDGDLQRGGGEVHLAGLTHAADGTVTAWIDGVPQAAGVAGYESPRAWSRLGGSLDDGYYGPNTRFAGTLGAVLIVPAVLDDEAMARIHAWARGRFGSR